MGEEVKVGDIDISKCDLKYVLPILKTCFECKGIDGLALADIDQLSVEAAVGHLNQWFRTNVEPGNLVQCDNCCGVSEQSLPACPYCGDAGEVIVEEAPPPEAPPVEQTKRGPGRPKGSGNKPKAEKPADAPKRGPGRPKGSGNKPKAEKPAEPECAVEEPAPADLSLPNVIGNCDVEVIQAGETPTEAVLDTISAAIRQAKADTAVQYWTLGAQIKVVFDTSLWKLRTTPDGKTRYTTFAQWCTAEIGLNSSVALSLMDVASKFSREDARRLGSSKLQLILRAPEGKQPELLEAAGEGASFRDIQKQVKQAKKEIGMEKRETGRKLTPIGKPGKKLKSPIRVIPDDDGRMTVAMVEGEVAIECFAKPAKGSVPVRARKLSDEPYAVEDMENGVTRRYEVLLRPEGLILKITTSR
jgi:hypothetical protein